MRSDRLAYLALIAVLGMASCGGGSARPSPTTRGADGSHAAARQSERSRRPRRSAELPRGGREILPHFRVLAYYGAPQTAKLGVLGDGSPSRAGRRLLEQARAYRRYGRPVLPAMQLIVSIASSSPGPDGLYRARQSDATVRRYLAAARRIHALLILDVQPGRAEFLREVEHLRKWLVQPDVSLALDPEWSMGPGEIPGQTIGHTSAAKVNQVSRYVADLVRSHALPQKLLIVHRFTQDMLRDAGDLQRRPGIALDEMIDGFGGQAAKRSKYALLERPGGAAAAGIKLFYQQDTNLMTPSEVMHLHPRPAVIVYQ